MNSVPSEWRTERLKNRVGFAYGDSLAAEDRIDGNVPVFGSNGLIGTHDRAITSGSTIIIGRKGSFGKITWSDNSCFPIDTTYFVDRTQTSQHLRWLYYALQNLQLDTVSFDSAVPGLSREVAYSLQVNFPPLPEQERIATYLDATCAAIDSAVTAKRRQIDILYDLQRVTVTKAVTRGLDESVQLKDSGLLELGQIPAHWRLTKLRYEISVRSGDFASDKFEDDGEYPVIGGNGEMGRAAAYNVDSEIVVVGRVGAQCGNTHFVKGRAWVSDNALIVESNHDKRFLTHLIRVLDFNSTAKKTAQPLVTGTQIKNTYVGMPPVAEQEEIVAFIENRTAQFDSLRATLSNQITTLLTYRKSLIHECVTGQRRVTEADIKRVQAHG